jgi:hypothetical protein
MGFGDGEREDHGEDWSWDVTQEEWEEGGYLPVLSLADDDVEIATDLVALCAC